MSEPTTREIARSQSGRGELVLRERRADGLPPVLELRANGVFVMDSRETSTEVALARAALEQVADPRDVVVGGLGLGYTLQTVLGDPRVELVSVVEIEESLVRWMRDGTIPHGPGLLADRRVRVINADLAMAVAEARGRHDVVLLDVDNGPGYLVHESNGSLYEVPFLTRLYSMLNPGGVVAVWSAARSPELETALAEAFDTVETQALPVTLQDREEFYWLHLARRSTDA